MWDILAIKEVGDDFSVLSCLLVTGRGIVVSKEGLSFNSQLRFVCVIVLDFWRFKILFHQYFISNIIVDL